MESAQEIIQRLLDERYEEGREAGYKDCLKGYNDGLKDGMKDGYDLALMRTEKLVASLRLEPVLAYYHGDENGSRSEAEPNIAVKPPVSPHLRRAYERLKQCPDGITSRVAREKWGGGSSVLYQLAKLGLAEKRGSQFFPKDEAAV